MFCYRRPSPPGGSATVVIYSSCDVKTAQAGSARAFTARATGWPTAAPTRTNAGGSRWEPRVPTAPASLHRHRRKRLRAFEHLLGFAIEIAIPGALLNAPRQHSPIEIEGSPYLAGAAGARGWDRSCCARASAGPLRDTMETDQPVPGSGPALRSSASALRGSSQRRAPRPAPGATPVVDRVAAVYAPACGRAMQPAPRRWLRLGLAGPGLRPRPAASGVRRHLRRPLDPAPPWPKPGATDRRALIPF
jgi:hypothetical protein